MVILLLARCDGVGAAVPIEIKEPQPRLGPSLGAGGLAFKYKRASGPMGFGGDMLHYGLRVFGGRPDDPRLGVHAYGGVLNGNSLKLSVDFGGLTLEDYWWRDGNWKWRVGFGGGQYELLTHVGQRTVSRGNFAYLEPMVVRVLPVTRHVHLEFAAGYFFCGVVPVKLEGVTLEVNLLIGRF